MDGPSKHLEPCGLVRDLQRILNLSPRPVCEGFWVCFAGRTGMTPTTDFLWWARTWSVRVVLFSFDDELDTSIGGEVGALVVE